MLRGFGPFVGHPGKPGLRGHAACWLELESGHNTPLCVSYSLILCSYTTLHQRRGWHQMLLHPSSPLYHSLPLYA